MAKPSAVRASLAEVLWSAALVAGFAAGIGWWRPGSGDRAPAILFGQGLPVVIGAVALAHAASLAWFRAPATIPRRDAFLLAVGLPVAVALSLGALLAAGIALADALGRLASFALYFKADPPASAADALGLAVAFAVAIPLVLVFVLVMRLAWRFAAPAHRDLVDALEAAQFTAGLLVAPIVLLVILAAPAVLPPATVYVLAAAFAGATLAALARRSLAAHGQQTARPERRVMPLAVGALAFAALGFVASVWAGLP